MNLKMSDFLFEEKSIQELEGDNESEGRLELRAELSNDHIKGGPELLLADVHRVAEEIASHIFALSANAVNNAKVRHATKGKSKEELTPEEIEAIKKADKILDLPLGVIDSDLLRDLFKKNYSVGYAGKIEGRAHLNPVQLKRDAKQVAGGTPIDLEESKKMQMVFMFLSNENSEIVQCKGKAIVFAIPALGANCIKGIDYYSELYPDVTEETPILYHIPKAAFFLLPFDEFDEFQTNKLQTIIRCLRKEKTEEQVEQEESGETNESFVYQGGLSSLLVEDAAENAGTTSASDGNGGQAGTNVEDESASESSNVDDQGAPFSKLESQDSETRNIFRVIMGITTVTQENEIDQSNKSDLIHFIKSQDNEDCVYCFEVENYSFFRVKTSIREDIYSFVTKDFDKDSLENKWANFSIDDLCKIIESNLVQNYKYFESINRSTAGQLTPLFEDIHSRQAVNLQSLNLNLDLESTNSPEVGEAGDVDQVEDGDNEGDSFSLFEIVKDLRIQKIRNSNWPKKEFSIYENEDTEAALGQLSQLKDNIDYSSSNNLFGVVFQKEILEHKNWDSNIYFCLLDTEKNIRYYLIDDNKQIYKLKDSDFETIAKDNDFKYVISYATPQQLDVNQLYSYLKQNEENEVNFFENFKEIRLEEARSNRPQPDDIEVSEDESQRDLSSENKDYAIEAACNMIVMSVYRKMIKEEVNTKKERNVTRDAVSAIGAVGIIGYGALATGAFLGTLPYAIGGALFFNNEFASVWDWVRSRKKVNTEMDYLQKKLKESGVKVNLSSEIESLINSFREIEKNIDSLQESKKFKFNYIHNTYRLKNILIEDNRQSSEQDEKNKPSKKKIFKLIDEEEVLQILEGNGFQLFDSDFSDERLFNSFMTKFNGILRKYAQIKIKNIKSRSITSFFAKEKTREITNSNVKQGQPASPIVDLLMRQMSTSEEEPVQALSSAINKINHSGGGIGTLLVYMMLTNPDGFSKLVNTFSGDQGSAIRQLANLMSNSSTNVTSERIEEVANNTDLPNLQIKTTNLENIFKILKIVQTEASGEVKKAFKEYKSYNEFEDEIKKLRIDVTDEQSESGSLYPKIIQLITSENIKQEKINDINSLNNDEFFCETLVTQWSIYAAINEFSNESLKLLKDEIARDSYDIKNIHCTKFFYESQDGDQKLNASSLDLNSINSLEFFKDGSVNKDKITKVKLSESYLRRLSLDIGFRDPVILNESEKDNIIDLRNEWRKLWNI